VAAAAALRELLDEEEHDTKSNPAPLKSRSALAARKRASMLAPKRGSMLESLEDSSLVAADADTSGTSTEGEDAASRREGRVARRRSMML
jgi:hypothetical protein